MPTAESIISGSPPLKVLLVEDSSLLAARLAELIRRLPEIDLVDTVDTEESALASLRAKHPHVLILDLHLRSGTGFGVLRGLRRAASCPSPKVIVLTNYGLAEFKLAAEAFGIDAFLDKSRDYYRLPALLTGYAKAQSADQQR